MAATARVIWLCACVRSWAYRRVGTCASVQLLGTETKPPPREPNKYIKRPSPLLFILRLLSSDRPGAHQMEPPSPIHALGVNPFSSRFIEEEEEEEEEEEDNSLKRVQP